jgi:hypothetical protein
MALPLIGLPDADTYDVYSLPVARTLEQGDRLIEASRLVFARIGFGSAILPHVETRRARVMK